MYVIQETTEINGKKYVGIMLKDGNWYGHKEVKQKYCEGRKI
jgi:hypothetical protein